MSMAAGIGLRSLGSCAAWLVFGAAAGVATTAGAFAFLMKIGVYPRMMGTSHTIRELGFYEWAIILGIICGGLYSTYPQLTLRVGYWFVVLWGLCAGIYVGCVAAALAEVLNVFPVLFRRLHVDRGIPYFMTMMALGKMSGALWYFWHGLQP